MLRILVLLGLVTASAAAVAAPALTADAAAKTIAAVAADGAKLKAFCAMNRALNADSDERPAAAEAAVDKEIESYFAVLGPEFRGAWDFGVGVNPDSPDGKTIDAAIGALEDKCDK